VKSVRDILVERYQWTIVGHSGPSKARRAAASTCLTSPSCASLTGHWSLTYTGNLHTPTNISHGTPTNPYNTRARLLPTGPTRQAAELKKVHQALALNGYPSWAIKRLCPMLPIPPPPTATPPNSNHACYCYSHY
jgi:hypothetical protein